MIKSEGGDSHVVLITLADYLYPLIIPIFWANSFIAENTDLLKTTNFFVSTLIISILYILTIDCIATVILKVVAKSTRKQS